MSKLGKLEEPLAYEFFKVLANRMRALKNEARRHRKSGNKKALACTEKAIEELLTLYWLADRVVTSHIYTPLTLLMRKSRKEKGVTLKEFNAVKPLLKASTERIEALELVLVNRMSQPKAAKQYGWCKQAMSRTMDLFYETLMKRANKVNEIYPPDRY
jgi:predicted DNA-binding protein (UPF0251 family)